MYDRQGSSWSYGSWIYNCVISAYHHSSCEFKPSLWRDVLDTTLCDKACQWLATGRWFSPGTQVSSTNKTDCHDITEILLKVVLNTITLPPFSVGRYTGLLHSTLVFIVSVQFFRYIKARINHICPLCTRQTCLVGFLFFHNCKLHCIVNIYFVSFFVYTSLGWEVLLVLSIMMEMLTITV